jgi:hypothetical protein
MSIASSQKANLQSLSSFGSSKADFVETGKMAEVEKLLAEYAGKFITAAQRNLRSKQKIDTGALMDVQFEVGYMGKSFVLTLGYEAGSKAAEYWDFVNQGVAGVGKTLSGSPYKFKTKGASKKMIDAMQGWITRHNIRPSDKYTISGLEKKRKSIRSTVSKTTKLRSLATAFARSIKKKGIQPTNYFDNALKLFNSPEFQKDLSEAVGFEVQVAIKNSWENNK